MTQGSVNDEQDREADPGDRLALPLVSVIIVNFNYGRFLEEAVNAVFAQTYPRVECIVVDNASTDDSLAVLDGLGAHHMDLRVLRRDRNDGQTSAALKGLAASNGAYIIFVDADDVLLPTGIEAHIYAHLSLRAHVGFTSGDMLQVEDGQIVVATGEDLNRYVRSGKGRRPHLVRPYRTASEGGWPSASIAARLDGKIHVVPPFHIRWVWSPTSGSCYRRDALMLFADNPALATLRTGTDMYFSHAIGALCGSALIDEPVFAYRIHGSNIYTQRAQLDRTLCFKPGGSGDNNDRARRLIIDHLVANADRFAPNFWLKLNLVLLLVRLDVPDATTGLNGGQRSRLARKLVEDPDTISPTLGPWLMRLLKVLRLVPFLRF